YRPCTNPVLAMSCLTQSATVNLIHHYCDIGVWTRMAIRFSERVAFVDDRTDKFLTTLARLGGYCTVEQAQAMGLASSASQVQAGAARQLLPHRGGLPYLADELVMGADDGGLSVAIVDRPHWTAFLQLLHFVTRFARCRASVGQRLTLIVAVGSEARQRMYE